MNTPLWFSNLAFWWAQVALLVLAAALLVQLLRLRQPRILLVHWRALTLICLLLPVLQPWRPLQILSPVSSAPDISFLPTVPAATHATSHWHFPDLWLVAEILAAIILFGIIARLAIFSFGLLKLRQLRRASIPFPTGGESPSLLDQMRTLVNARAEFRLSAEVDSPVTFGFAAPVILLPERFPQLPPQFQSAIACHELLHVRRNDWAHHLAEEILRVAFWFHPAVLWLISRVRLAREQIVDLEVIRLTQARKTYLEALLEFTPSRSRIAAIPAPPFLVERQFGERVALMLKEVRMSRTRLLVSLSAIVCTLGLAAVFAVSVFPLKAAARPLSSPLFSSRLPRVLHSIFPQNARPQQSTDLGPAPILRSVVVKYRGFDDATLNDTTVQEQKEYLQKFLKDPPRVETPYDQRTSDEMRTLIETFWKAKGVEVEVRSTLTPIPETRSARLLFNVQNTQGASQPAVNESKVWTGKVKQGTMSIDVRGLGTMALLNGQPVAKIRLPESQSGDVRAGQGAGLEYGQDRIGKGHVIQISPQVIEGKRSVLIALDSPVPNGVGRDASVEGTIQVGELKDVVYVGLPHPANMSVTPQGQVVGVIYKITDDGKEAERLEVQFGRASVQTIQVLSGLKPGDTIILSNMSAYDKFDRIQIIH